MAIGGELRLRVSVNEGLIAKQVMKQGLYDAFVGGMLDAAQEFQEGSPVGATGDLKAGWDISSPRKESVTFDINASIVNYSQAAKNRIAGRAPGTPPPVSPLVDWVIAKGLASNPKKALGIAFAIRNKIAKQGTDRHIAQNNWVGIRSDGSRIPGGRLEQVEAAIAKRLNAFSRS